MVRLVIYINKLSEALNVHFYSNKTYINVRRSVEILKVDYLILHQIIVEYISNIGILIIINSSYSLTRT